MNLITQRERAELAHSQHVNIVMLRRQMERTFLQLGEALYVFERERHYELLDHPSFNSYLADPDVNIGRTMAYMLKAVHEHYVLSLRRSTDELEAAGISKLYLLREHTDENNADEWIAKAASLSRSDLRIELDGEEPVVDYRRKRCPTCGGSGWVDAS